VSIHVLRRRARISAAGDAVQLSAGGLAVLQEEVAHSAAALSDCTLLITVAMASAASR
jgi:hypothetical protein